jgi:hypothetical protein
LFIQIGPLLSGFFEEQAETRAFATHLDRRMNVETELHNVLLEIAFRQGGAVHRHAPDEWLQG